MIEDDTNFEKKKSNFIVPTIQEADRHSAQTAVGVYVANSVIAWALLSRENLLKDWNLLPIEVDAKKWHITSVYDTVRSILPLFPKADLYVMEDMKKPTVNQLANPLMVSNIRLMECIVSMLYLYLSNPIENLQESGDDNKHHVFFLRSPISARLSETYVGNERIAAENVVMEIINSSEGSNKLNQFTPIKIGLDINETFSGRKSVERECLYRALLLVMSFMDLVIRERRESLRFLQKQ